MKRALVIFNPVSGLNSRVNVKGVIEGELEEERWDWDWYETKAVEYQDFDRFLKRSYDLIIVIGGDGTVNEVANFIVVNNLDTPLAIIAQGSANLLAKSLRIPSLSVRKGIQFALKKEGRFLDIMRVNGQWLGLIAVGQGYDVVFIHGASRVLKRWMGFFAYVVSFFKTYFAHRRHDFKVIVDGDIYNVKAKLVVVFNVLSLVGIPVHKSVKPDNGFLTVAIINPYNIVDLIPIFLKTVFGFKNDNDKKLRLLIGKKISIAEKGASQVQVDGDLKDAKKLDIEVLPNLLKVIY